MDTTVRSDKLARQMRQKVYAYLLETRAWKYRSFLWYLRFFKYISFSPVRGEFLESYYTLMRFIDDIVDGDAPLPSAYQNAEDYIQPALCIRILERRSKVFDFRKNTIQPWPSFCV